MFTEKHILVRKVLQMGKTGLQLETWVESTVFEVKTYWRSSKENVLRSVVGKEGNTDSHVGHERTHHYGFPWKSCRTC